MSVKHVFPGCIVTDVCTIFRWPDAVFKVRPGVYNIISSWGVLELLSLWDDHYGGFSHPVAVVDDFGDLVGVPT